MGIFALIKFFFLRDFFSSFRVPARWIEAPVFFLLLCLLFPLALTPDSQQLQSLAPGLIWLGLLLSNLLSLNVLWSEAFKHGVFEQMLLSPQPLLPMIFGKLLAQWMIIILPLLIVLPFTALILQLPASIIPLLLCSALLGIWILTGLGTLGATLLMGLPQSGALLAVLIFPWYLPVLIFGTNIISNGLMGGSIMAPLCLLIGLFFLVLGLAPIGLVAAIRLSVER